MKDDLDLHLILPVPSDLRGLNSVALW